MPSVPFEACHAKTTEDNRPGMSVYDHCVIVGAVARRLVELLPPRVASRLPSDTIVLAALHDVGKVSPGFQLKYFRRAMEEKLPGLRRLNLSALETDHARIGGSALWRRLGGGAMPAAAQIVAAHHGRILRSPERDDGIEIFGGPGWSEERARLITALESHYGSLSSAGMRPAVRNVVAGLTTVADWIGSDERFFPAHERLAPPQAARRAAEAVEACGLHRPAVRSSLQFQQVFGFTPHVLQSVVAESAERPGLFILEAPMGMGKTEAALFAAYRLISKGLHNGLFFGLPTRLTSNRIHIRLERFLERVCSNAQRAKLVHGQAWLEEFAAGGEELKPGGSWFDRRKRGLIHPFVVGTIDQALLSVLRVKHHFVRSYALAGKVVILDEVHSYDSYTGALLEELVHDLLELGCTVIILSATLTAERRNAFFPSGLPGPQSTAYPLLSTVKEDGVACQTAPGPATRTYSVRVCDWSDQLIAEELVSRARSGCCVLAISNSVARAQSWFRLAAACAEEGEFPMGLLHSKFAAFHRQEIEEEWLSRLGKPNAETSRPRGCVLIATQVVEQSVDIDADFLLTELAPTDMILQRMGRQWRHPLPARPCERPETVIVTADPSAAATAEEIVDQLGKVNCLVYSPYVLWRSFQVWSRERQVRLPDDMRRLLQATYGPDPGPRSPAVEELKALHESRAERLRAIASANRALVQAMPVGDDRESVPTRYSDYTTAQALLTRGYSSDGMRARIRLLDGTVVETHAHVPDLRVSAALHRNVVILAAHLLLRSGPLQTPAPLRKHFAEPITVLVWDPCSGALARDGRPLGLSYSARLGIMKSLRAEEDGSEERWSDPEYESFDVFDKSLFDW
jgi:CRISPR-associated endonuclease/helicase Cas3